MLLDRSRLGVEATTATASLAGDIGGDIVLEGVDRKAEPGPLLHVDMIMVYNQGFGLVEEAFDIGYKINRDIRCC